MQEENLECLKAIEKINSIACWKVDIRRKKMYWLDEMYSILGFNSHTAKRPSGFRKLILEEDLPFYKERFKQLVSTQKPTEAILRFKAQNGKTIYCVLRASIIDEEGRSVIIGTLQNLSNFVEFQETMNQAIKKAEEANISKSYFLSQTSHDLRQPMQALKIFIHNLIAENLTSKQETIARRIKKATNNLDLLLDNLLDISKLESGGFKNERTEFDVGTVLDDLFIEFNEIASLKNIKMRFLNTHQIIKSDPILIERILRNFLSNALKYTKDKILLACRRKKGILKIMVFDNGIGIDKHDLPHIFDDFFQSSKIKNNRRNGAGLGLPIVRKLALIIDGYIDIKSTPNIGSCFSLEVPIRD